MCVCVYMYWELEGTKDLKDEELQPSTERATP